MAATTLFFAVCTKRADGAWKNEFGNSMLASTLYNLGTHRDSQRYDAGENGPRSSKAAIHPQTMPLKNPNGDHRAISFSGYGGPYNLTVRGNFYQANASCAIPGSCLGGWIEDAQLHTSCDLYLKSAPNFAIWNVGSSVRRFRSSSSRSTQSGGNGATIPVSAIAGKVLTTRGATFMSVGSYF